MKKDTITYQIGDSLYINLTNRCSNDCEFCVRNHKDGVDGYYLWLTREPTVDEILGELAGIEKYKEVVFCGFGEPTYRTDDMLAIARHVKARGASTRLNTNGLGNLINGRDVTRDIAEAIDTVSISLNATNAKEYQRLCRSVYGENAFFAMLDFARRCAGYGTEVVMSVVDTIGADELEKSRKIADELGVKFRVREFIP